MGEKSYKQFAADPEDIGRINKEDKHAFRNKFQRDRDRILYSKAFRRLSGKTQVFVAGFDDHVRTRLTHTLEVVQITKTICRKLQLNEDLGEAIALGHDIGHTPFGHMGERTLNYIMTGCDLIKGINDNMKDEYKGFKHNLQGLRVAMDLEKISRDFNGLNLTPYTLWGIMNHTNTDYKDCNNKFSENNVCGLRRALKKCPGFDKMFSLNFYNKYKDEVKDDECWTVEALIVGQADEIAQRHHDIEDGLEANIVDKDELIEMIQDNFKDWLKEKSWYDELEKLKLEKDKTYYLPKLSKIIVDFLVTKYIDSLKKTLEELISDYNINTKEDFNKVKFEIYQDKGNALFDLFKFRGSLKKKDKKFQNFLKNRILNSFLAQSMDGKSNYIIRQLFKAYVTNPQQLPDKTIYTLYKSFLPRDEWIKYENLSFSKVVGQLRNELHNNYFTKSNEEFNMILLRTICDYIAGMTDRYAMEQYELLYGSKHIG